MNDQSSRTLPSNDRNLPPKSKMFLNSNLNAQTSSAFNELLKHPRPATPTNNTDLSYVSYNFEENFLGDSSKDSYVGKTRSYLLSPQFNNSESSALNDIPKSIDSEHSPFNSTLLDYRQHNVTSISDSYPKNSENYNFNVNTGNTYTYTLLLSIILSSRNSEVSVKSQSELEGFSNTNFQIPQSGVLKDIRKSSQSLFSSQKNYTPNSSRSRQNNEKTFSLIEIKTPLKTQAFSDYNLVSKADAPYLADNESTSYSTGINSNTNHTSFNLPNSNLSKIKKIFNVKIIKEKTNSLFKRNPNRKFSNNKSVNDNFDPMISYNFLQQKNKDSSKPSNKVSPTLINVSFKDQYDTNSTSYIVSNKALLNKFAIRLIQIINENQVHPLTMNCLLETYKLLSQEGYIDDVSNSVNLEVFISTIIKLTLSKISSENVVDIEILKQLTSHQVKYPVELIRSILKTFPKTNEYTFTFLLNLNSIVTSHLEKVFADSLESSSVDKIHILQQSKLNANFQSSTSSNIHNSSRATSKKHSPLLEWTRIAFGISINDHNSAYKKLKEYATELNLNDDIQKCLNLTLIDQSFACNPYDFDSKDAYDLWKQRELTSLDQLLELSIKRGMESAKEFKDKIAMNSNGFNLGLNFHLIPPNVYGNYRNLVFVMVQNDILSPYLNSPSIDYRISAEADRILKICSISWRISGAFHATCYLEAIKDLWIKNDLPPQYLYDSLGKVEQLSGLISQDLWIRPQKIYLDKVCKDILIRTIYILEDLLNDIFSINKDCSLMIVRIFKYIDTISPTLNSIRSKISFLDTEDKMVDDYLEIESSLSPIINLVYNNIMTQDIADSESAFDRTDQCLIACGKILEINKSLKSSFPLKPGVDLNKKLDIASAVTFFLSKRLISEIRGLNESQLDGKDQINILAGIELYNQCKKITNLSSIYRDSESFSLVINEFLEKKITMWLKVLERESPGWVRNSLLSDKSIDFSTSAKHSTSVWDLLTSFSQQVTVSSQIDWPNPQIYGRFLTEFCRIMGDNFHQYTNAIEQQFNDIQKSNPKILKNKGSSGSYNSLSGENLSILNAPKFSLDMCIKLNNLYIAHKQLIDMFNELKIPQTIEDLGGINRPSMLELEKKDPRFVYTVEVVNAEEIEFHKQGSSINSENSKYPFVKLSMSFNDKSMGTKYITVGKTRPVPSNAMNPRWEEEFDIEPHPMFSLPSQERKNKGLKYPIVIELCTKNTLKNLINKESVHGRGIFYLSKELLFSAGSSIDTVVKLEPRGFINLRISINQHVDDVEYHCIRMLNNLSRSLKDLQQRISEEASYLIRSHLIKTLFLARELDDELQREQSRQDIGSKDGRLSVNPTQNIQTKRESFKLHLEVVSNTFYALKSGLKRSSNVKAIKKEWEEGLIPIVDYLENNLHILHKYLYEEVALGVILKIWKNILNSFEDIILPQLHGSSLGISKKLSPASLESFYNAIEFFKWFFNGGDDADGISLDLLENQSYTGLIFVKEKYVLSTNDLIDAYLEEIRLSVTNKYQIQQFKQQSNPSNAELFWSHKISAKNNPKQTGFEKSQFDKSILRKHGHVVSHSLDIKSTKDQFTSGFVNVYEKSQNSIKNKVNNITGLLKNSESDHKFSISKTPNPNYRNHNSQKDDNEMGPSFNYRVVSSFPKNDLPTANSNIILSDNMDNEKTSEKKGSFSKRHSFANMNLDKETQLKASLPNNSLTNILLYQDNEVKDQSSRRSDLILRLLKLSSDKVAKKFVKSQLEIRIKQLQYEYTK
ncbi:hypothetical protein AYI68_g2370 [Smittium mucronatum]|uniref:Uncharacterized protein n=1 Tax=Smittium mucronatum TaxID=133383 RepID=A0A1R0H2U6_9FUNG|nr:hypothetical protein AYI68_g2370 [Smittium mucronatum]